VIGIGASGVSVEGQVSPASVALELRGLMAQKLRGRRQAIIRATPDSDAALLLAAVTAAQGTALTSLQLDCGQYHADISGSLRRQAVDEWITLFVDNERAMLSADTDRPSAPNELVFAPGDPSSERELSSWLAPRCTGKTCVIRLRLRAGETLVRLAPALDSLRRAGTQIVNLGVELHDESPPRVKTGAQSLSGRLPPEVIQRIVRQNFGKFRTCYEAGLARDAKLTGKVLARFVIGRDGKVSNVTDDGSDLPDTAVRDCVLQALRELVFPQPEGGIVTVVYPIVFAPD
jgi:hypothetical protein